MHSRVKADKNKCLVHYISKSESTVTIGLVKHEGECVLAVYFVISEMCAL